MINIIYYFFGSFASGGGDVAAVDLIIVLLGYYGQDLFRSGSLKLVSSLCWCTLNLILQYFWLTLVSLITDTCVLIVVGVYIVLQSQILHIGIWVFVILAVVWGIETGAKIASMVFARRLHKHLETVPGQSVQTA